MSPLDAMLLFLCLFLHVVSNISSKFSHYVYRNIVCVISIYISRRSWNGHWWV